MNDNPYLYALTTDPNKPLRDAQERIARLTAERDEARRDAERWQADALRLIRERNAAENERDALRLELWDLQRGFCNVASSLNKAITGSPRRAMQIARDKGWKCFEDEAYGPLED